MVVRSFAVDRPRQCARPTHAGQGRRDEAPCGVAKRCPAVARCTRRAYAGRAARTGRFSSIGDAIHSGSRVATAEGRPVGPDGTLFGHATTTCLIFDAR
jgi:hypothetical protein